jgi:hypothetical protein
LTHAQHHPTHAHPAANMLVDGIWRFFCYHTRPQQTPIFFVPITLSYGIAISTYEWTEQSFLGMVRSVLDMAPRTLARLVMELSSGRRLYQQLSCL